ncbi:hypothetical protein [Bacillus pumilus]|uniref:hypothetical protein n=1 Tax=Bacillus pumilus TaxID=1408 RepID=UPI0021C2D142|nr:hypothetical protein [Bacillus pumilus]
MKQIRRSMKAGAALAGICTLLLTGCGGQSSFHDMQEAMTKMSEKEASFEKSKVHCKAMRKKSNSSIKK